MKSIIDNISLHIELSDKDKELILSKIETQQYKAK